MENLPKSRKEAKAVGGTQYFTGKPCKHGHLVPKFTSSGSCTECLKHRRRAGMRKWAQENPEEKKRRAAAWYSGNKEEIIERVRANYYKDLDRSRERGREYAERHREEAKQRAREWAEENPERRKENDKTWREANPALSASHKAKYRASKRNACPPWLTKEHLQSIRDIYTLRQEVSEKTGVVHQVDHIVPLQGKYICGLHVPWNLQLLTAVENNRKNNSFEQLRSLATPK